MKYCSINKLLPLKKGEKRGISDSKLPLVPLLQRGIPETRLVMLKESSLVKGRLERDFGL
jgi:hypothetical protein